MLAEERAVRQRFWVVVTGTALTAIVSTVALYALGDGAAPVVVLGVLAGYAIIAQRSGGGVRSFGEGTAVFALLGAVTLGLGTVVDTFWVQLIGWGLAWTCGVAYATAGEARSWRLLPLVPVTVIAALVSVVLVWVVGPLVTVIYPFAVAWAIRSGDFLGPERI